MKNKRTVCFVGAGPGDAGLLTRQAAEVLEHAEVVVHDGGISPGIVKLAVAAKELLAIDAAHDPTSTSQALLERANQGGRVVRLVQGDPGQNPRAVEEAVALAKVGIALDLVPGLAQSTTWPARPGLPLAATGPKKDRKPGIATSDGAATGSLHGQRIVVTRSREQAGRLSDLLREKGAEVLEVPTIRIAPPLDKEPLKEALLGLGEYDWLVFTSVNGVDCFFDYFFRGFPDLRDLGAVRIAAVGPVTAARIKEFHLVVDAMPSEAIGKKVAQAMAEQGSLENERICLLRAEKANPELPRLLEEKGAIVDDVACYRNEPETEDPTGTAAALERQGADWITFTSGSTVENFNARFNLARLLERFPALRTVTIGPETSKTMAALSLAPTVEAKEHNIEGLVKALEKHRSA